MGATATSVSELDVGDALECISHGLLVFEVRTGECELRYANSVFADITGYDAEALSRSPLWQLLAGADSDPLVQQQLRTALAAVQAVSVEWLIYRKDGVPLWTRIATRPLASVPHAPQRLVVTIEDIADYKHARESLRASEGRLDVAMEASSLSMWDWNVSRDEIYYNDRWQISLGIDPASLLGREELSGRLLLPEDQPEVLQQFEDHYHGRTSHFSSEYQLTTETGERKWFEANARVVRRDKEGRPLRMIGVLHDISDRKHALQEATQTQQRWERAVRGTSDGLYDWNLLTGHVWYAARFREIVGHTNEDFPDTFSAFQDVLHPEDRSLVLGKIRAHLENHARLDVRCRVATRTDETIWCRLRGETERDAAGRPLRLSGSISDIRGQVEAEEALNRSQDFYGTILDSLPLFIAYTDRHERIVYANRIFQEFFSVPLARSRGRVIVDVIGDRRYGAIGPFVREALQGKATEGQGRFRAQSGRVLDLDAVFLPHYDEYGELQGCIVAARDMTEKRQLEAELRQSQKMEAVGRLTGGIAHDFNNLLSVIVGNMQLLARSLRESPRLLRQADTALSAAMRGAALTRRLLAFARQQVLEPKVMDVNALVGGMYELLRRTLTREIEIEQQLDPEVWAMRADPGQLENAVLNLVINARDAMPSGGAIMIRTLNLTVDTDSAVREEGLNEGDYTLLEVADTGMGMSAQVLKRVFEPFFTTKDIGKGSGLGLSMVYGFMKQSGGHVCITSAPNQGTTVHLYFPRVHASLTRAPQDPAPVELPRGHEFVLVVEDNAEVRGTVVDILSSFGYRIFEAANGHEALQQFMQHPEIQLVFSDVMLPGGLLGTQLVHKLTERRPGLKVLMTSGFSESGIMTRGVLDGSIEVLQKPYKVEELARRVRAILDGKEEAHRVPA
jgi:PAS domain S-box-containing protein